MTSAAAQLVRRRGYAFLDGLYDPAELAELAATLDALRARFGADALTAREPVWLADNVEVAGPGLAIYQLLGFAPAMAPRLFKPDAIAVVRELLGEDMHLELVGGVLSDETRPFTEWENHLGGIDDERWRRQGKRPRNTRINRVLHFVFLEPLDEDSGPWRVLPRSVGDPVDPPAPTRELDWPGVDSLSCDAGSVLLLEESVWHAVVPRQLPGIRRFIGAVFSSASVQATVGRDESLVALRGQVDDPLFQSLLAEGEPG